MDDLLPLLPPFDHASNRQWAWARAPAPFDLRAGLERERETLTEYWRRLLLELERIDGRLEQLDSLLDAF